MPPHARLVRSRPGAPGPPGTRLADPDLLAEKDAETRHKHLKYIGIRTRRKLDNKTLNVYDGRASTRSIEDWVIWMLEERIP